MIAARHRLTGMLWRPPLLLLALLAGYFALGGRVGTPEAGLVLACVGMNEFRHRFENTGLRMMIFWLGLFIAGPALYVALSLRTTENIAERFDAMLLPTLLVALALPFQSFAAYLPTLPRAAHLVYSFVLIELLLGVRREEVKVLWPLAPLILLVMAYCLYVSRIAKSDRAAIAGRKSPGAAASFRALFTFFSLSLCSAVVMAGFFILLPRWKDPALAAQDKSVAGKPAPVLMEARRPATPRPAPGEREPRINTTASGISGLSDAVRPGAFSTLLRDERRLAHVRVKQASESKKQDYPQTLLCKAYTFDHFDGDTWRAANPAGKAAVEVPYEGAWTFAELRGERPSVRGMPLELEFVYELLPSAADFVFALPYASESVMVVESLNGEALLMDVTYDPASDVLRGSARQPGAEIALVRARSVLPPNNPITGRREPVGDADAHRRLTDVSVRWKDALRVRWPEFERFRVHQPRPLELAAELEKWFSKNGEFQYSLEQVPGGENALLDFICERNKRVGYCEYFASAMTLALRSFGVPCRLCGGYAPRYIGGEGWEIRFSDAHAWVEVFVEGVGWRSFDPTPPEARVRSASQPPPALPAATTKTSSLKPPPPPGDPILDFSRAWQSEFFRSLGDAAGRAWNWLAMDVSFAATGLLPESIRPESRAARAGLFWSVVTATGVILLWLRRRRGGGRLTPGRRRQALRASPRAPVSRLYEELDAVLARQGFRRRRGETPREFARTVLVRGGLDYRGVEEATDIYYMLRYGAEEGTEGLAKRFAELLAALKALPARQGLRGSSQAVCSGL